MEKRQHSAEYLARSFKGWRKRIKRLESAAAKSGRREFRAEVASLKERQRAVKELLRKLDQSGTMKRRQMHSGVEQAWNQLRQSLQDAMRRIDDKRP